jgi:hypothetical protein
VSFNYGSETGANEWDAQYGWSLEAEMSEQGVSIWMTEHAGKSCSGERPDESTDFVSFQNNIFSPLTDISDNIENGCMTSARDE